MTHNPWGPEPMEHEGRPRITFSGREVLHLVVAVVVLTLCFTLAREQRAFPRWLSPNPIDLAASAIAVSTGFVLHELMHKIVAQRYGHWAEFRAQFGSLLGSLGVVVGTLLAGTPVLVAAPGAVWIQGAVTPRQNGIISLVGPATNIVLAAIAWPFTWATDLDAPLPHIMLVVAFVNAGLAIFNLIPMRLFGNELDGRKVLRWNPAVYILCMAAAVAIFVCILVGVHPKVG